jgi:hypothetical protein
MSATSERDPVNSLAKSDSRKALAKARGIDEAWFRAQALAWVARFADEDPRGIAREAAKAAGECDDAYKRSAVRAWEIAALAEREFKAEARESLGEAVALGEEVTPISSRSEALYLLLQAACRIGAKEAKGVYEVLVAACPVEAHWRCKRAVRDGGKIIAGELKPRVFFW